MPNHLGQGFVRDLRTVFADITQRLVQNIHEELLNCMVHMAILLHANNYYIGDFL